MSSSASVKKHHLDPKTEPVFLRKITKLVWIKHHVTGCQLYWGLSDLAGKVNSLEFKSLIYTVMSVPTKYVQYLQSIWDTTVTWNIYWDLCAWHCAKCYTEIIRYNPGSHTMRYLIIKYYSLPFTDENWGSSWRLQDLPKVTLRKRQT